MSGTSLSIYERAQIMMRRLQRIEDAHSDKVASGAYNGRVRQMKCNGGKIYSMLERCRALFQNIAAAKWDIPVGSELMRELEACEYEVAAVLAVMQQKK